MTLSNHYLIIQDSSIKLYNSKHFEFDDVYHLLNAHDIRVVLLPHHIDIWMNDSDSQHEEIYTEVRVNRVPTTCFSGTAIAASSSTTNCHIQGLSNKQMAYIHENVTFMRTLQFTFLECLSEIEDLEKEYPFLARI